jgi:hypothetical protein
MKKGLTIFNTTGLFLVVAFLLKREDPFLEVSGMPEMTNTTFRRGSIVKILPSLNRTVRESWL